MYLVLLCCYLYPYSLVIIYTLYSFVMTVFCCYCILFFNCGFGQQYLKPNVSELFSCVHNYLTEPLSGEAGGVLGTVGAADLPPSGIAVLCVA